ncbi:uncharacterized protein LOC114299047 [Camellia sinensis]|uniref:uncharacterized protein LOC114299047 n=1 Tax=Camellia sinensis TaxID=4442 RepID=UPI0010357C45|nr:uncharacterized protein LOC114299047 [Camellia sinensis]
MRVHPKGASGELGLKRVRVGEEVTPMEESAAIREKGVEETPKSVVVPNMEGDKGQGGQEEEEHMSAMPKVPVESRSAGPKEVMEQQPKGAPAPQGEGARLTTAIYHARAVAGRLEGEEGPARAAADHLVGIVEDAAGNIADRAHAELLAVGLELEDERRKVVLLEFQLAGDQKKLRDAQNACTVATERFEEAMINNEELRAQQIKEKDEADVKIAGLQKELEDERARTMEEKARLQKELEDEKIKATSERAAYPNLEGIHEAEHLVTDRGVNQQIYAGKRIIVFGESSVEELIDLCGNESIALQIENALLLAVGEVDGNLNELLHRVAIEVGGFLERENRKSDNRRPAMKAVRMTLSSFFATYRASVLKRREEERRKRERREEEKKEEEAAPPPPIVAAPLSRRSSQHHRLTDHSSSQHHRLRRSSTTG